MRKVLSILCALMIAALFPLSWMISQGLPVDTTPYVAQKYAGWNGVLQVWIYSRWCPGGSFITWLNGCAADFEKSHEGVYIEFTPVDEEALRTMNESGIRKPDMVFFSPGVLTSASGLAELPAPGNLRSEFTGFTRALPVAMGGYIWVYNRELTGSAPTDRTNALPLTLLPDDSGHNFSAGTIALLSSDPLAPDAEIELPDAGIDLGLPANAQIPEVLQSGDALDMFIDGELSALAVTQKELARLSRLRDSGKGPDWACAAAGQFAWADQLLLAGVIDQGGSEREALAREFAGGLFDDEAQAALADAGAFSVTGETIHADFSVYSEMDRLINGLPLAVPDAFSEHSLSNGGSIIRDYCQGLYSPREAIGKLGLRYSLQDQPN